MTAPRGRRAVVCALGIAQTLSWASSYYLPPVLADPIAGDLGLSRDWFFGVFSAALLLSGLVLERAGPHWALLLSAGLTFGAFLALSCIPRRQARPARA